MDEVQGALAAELFGAATVARCSRTISVAASVPLIGSGHGNGSSSVSGSGSGCGNVCCTRTEKLPGRMGAAECVHRLLSYLRFSFAPIELQGDTCATFRAQKSEMGPLGVPFQGASPGLPATQTEYGTVPMLPGAACESSTWRSGSHSAFYRDRNRSNGRSS